MKINTDKAIGTKFKIQNIKSFDRAVMCLRCWDIPH